MEMITVEQFENMTKEKQFEALMNATKEAEKDDTPYVGIVDNEIHIIGDANKTKIKKHNYEISFAFPNTPEWRKTIKDSGEIIEKETENFLKVTRKYENVYLVPRQASDVMEAFTRVLSFMKDITEEVVNEETGETELVIKDISNDGVMNLFSKLNKEVEDSLYDAVGKFFALSEVEKDMMLLSSVMYNAVSIVVNNPEIINESDLFFG